MPETAKAKEQILLNLFRDPGMTFGELHKKIWTAGDEIIREEFGRIISELKQEGLLRVRRFRERPGEVRYNLTRAGIEEAIEIMNGGDIGGVNRQGE